jgi:hypothetical protein
MLRRGKACSDAPLEPSVAPVSVRQREQLFSRASTTRSVRASVGPRLEHPEPATADYLPQFVCKPPDFAPREGCRYCNVDAVDVVRCYWKEGLNVGASGMLRHYPMQDITFAVLAIGEH